jgi:hypothetical protein
MFDKKMKFFFPNLKTAKKMITIGIREIELYNTLLNLIKGVN